MQDEEIRRKLREARASPDDTGAKEAALRTLLRGRPNLRPMAQLAANLGDEVCRRVVGYVPRKKKTRQKLSVWMWGLKPGGKEAFIRAGLAMETRRREDRFTIARRGLIMNGLADSIKIWLRCPCLRHEEIIEAWVKNPGGFIGASLYLGRACLSCSFKQVRRLVSRVASLAVDGLYEIYATGHEHQEAIALAEERLKEAITTELLPWALKDLAY